MRTRPFGLGATHLVALVAFGAAAPKTLAAVAVTEDGEQTSLAITVDDVTVDQVSLRGQAFVVPHLRGVDGYAAVYHDVGAPELPVIRLFVDGDVEVKSDVGIEMFQGIWASTGALVAPAQPSVDKRPGAVAAYAFNTQAYSTDRFMIGKSSTLDDAGSVRGVPQRLLTLYPVDYNPAQRTLRIIRHFDVTVHHGHSPFAVSSPSAPKGMIAFVVAGIFEQSQALADYVAFKKAQGFDVKTLIFGRDVTSADSIRAALKGLLTSDGLKYAIMVGDSNTIPAHSARHMSGPTDHYYRAIDTADYESDINGPDIGVGRFSARTEEHLRAIVDKYIRYQQMPAFTAEPWQMKIAFAATSDSGNYQIAEGTHNYVINTYTKTAGYMGTFPQADAPGGDRLYAITNHASGTNLLNAILEGRNFVTYSGHGYSGGWVGPSLDASALSSLSNPNYIPFVQGFACNTANYVDDPNFAETWQRSPNGAITYFGSVDSSQWDEDDILERAMYDAIFAGKVEFGAMLNTALSEVWRHYGGSGQSKYYWESYTTFGDPSATLRTGL